MPPPTTTTWLTGHGGSGEHPIGERADDDGIVVEHAGAGEGEAGLLGHLRRLDVEVVEHLEVVGHEALRAHAHPGGPAGGRRARG